MASAAERSRIARLIASKKEGYEKAQERYERFMDYGLTVQAEPFRRQMADLHSTANQLRDTLRKQGASGLADDLGAEAADASQAWDAIRKHDQGTRDVTRIGTDPPTQAQINFPAGSMIGQPAADFSGASGQDLFVLVAIAVGVLLIVR